MEECKNCQSLSSRLKESEAENEKLKKEIQRMHDAAEVSYHDLKSRLKEAEKNLEIERLGWKTIVEERDLRLSQAEAENETLKLCLKNSNALIADGADEAEKIVGRLQKRLSHLMDVAGRLKSALETKEFDQTYEGNHWCSECDGGHMKYMDDCKYKLALAEWDGIKNVQ